MAAAAASSSGSAATPPPPGPLHPPYDAHPPSRAHARPCTRDYPSGAPVDTKPRPETPRHWTPDDGKGDGKGRDAEKERVGNPVRHTARGARYQPTPPNLPTTSSPIQATPVDKEPRPETLTEPDQAPGRAPHRRPGQQQDDGDGGGGGQQQRLGGGGRSGRHQGLQGTRHTTLGAAPAGLGVVRVCVRGARWAVVGDGGWGCVCTCFGNQAAG